MNERTKQIDNFIEKWNAMLEAANEVSDFKWNFSVTITSNDSIKDDRIRAINGINESFTKNRFSWTSNSD